MNIKNLTCAAIGVVLMSTFARANEVFDFTGQTLNAFDNFGDPDNQTVNGPIASGNYILPGTATVNTLTLTEVVSATWAEDFKVRIFFASAPTLYAEMQPTTLGDYAGTTTVSNVTRPLTGPLVGANIIAGQQWRMEIADTFQDGATNQVEQRATNFKFTVAPVPAQTFVVSGETRDIIGDPSNSIVNLGAHTGAPYRVGPDVRLSGGVMVRIASGSNAEALVVLRNSANPGQRMVIAPSEQTGVEDQEEIFGTRFVNLSNVLTPTNSPSNYSNNLYGALIPSGSVWTVEFAEAIENTLNLVEAGFADVSISLYPGTFAPPTALPPMSAFDLGRIDITNASVSSPLSVFATSFGADFVQWVRFTTPGFTDPGLFMDIYGTLADGVTDDEDTEFGLFNSNGLLIANNDDDAVGFLSLLTLGYGSGPRAPIAQPNPLPPFINPGDSVPFDGRSGDGLPAGTYYVAIAHYNTTFYHGFGVTPPTSVATGPNANVGSWNFNIRTNTPAVTISGRLNLQDTVNDGFFGGETIVWTLEDGVRPPVSGTFDVADFGTSIYSIVVPAAYAVGNYHLRFKGGTFLSKTVGIGLVGNSITVVEFSLKNGDIDQDGEVGPSDFELVVAQFGGPGSADVDNDEEVGPSDFEIIVANFGIGDE